MRGSIKAIIAGGPPAIIASGAGIMYANDNLHYLLRPSIRDTLLGVAGVVGASIWVKAKGKGKAPTPAPEATAPTETTHTVIDAPALPPAQKRPIDPFNIGQQNLARHPRNTDGN